MAKIEMDMTEYKAMEENKKLLEKSLENEAALRKQIQDLNAEKIKVLEEAGMKVVKVQRMEKRDYIVARKHPEEIKNQLKGLFSSPFGDHRLSEERLEYLNVSSLCDMFFEKRTAENFDVEEEITLHGLDEIKAEIREDLKAKLDKDTKSKITKAETIINENSNLLAQNEILARDKTAAENNANILMEQLDELKEKFKKLKDKQKTIQEIKEVLKVKAGFGYKLRGYDKIKSIIEKLES